MEVRKLENFKISELSDLMKVRNNVFVKVRKLIVMKVRKLENFDISELPELMKV